MLSLLAKSLHASSQGTPSCNTTRSARHETEYLLGNHGTPGASLVKESSWIDPDFQERSLTIRFVHVRALSFCWDQKIF